MKFTRLYDRFFIYFHEIVIFCTNFLFYCPLRLFYLACHKRPISVNQINQLVDEVETEIFNREEKEIPSSLIGELVMDKLKDLEAVAYVRFASVYREFKDVNTFMSELKKMLDK